MKEHRKRKKRKKIYRLFAAVFLTLFFTFGLFCLKPDWWYLLTAGSDRSRISVDRVQVQMTEYSMEELEQMENVEFDQSMMLINTEYMLPEDFTAQTGEYRESGVMMNSCILEAYGRLADAVKEKTGEKLYISSGIRNKEKQKLLYEEDPDTATLPGASEHETGLCMDVYVAGFAGDGFLKAEAGQFVNSDCHEYGFIIRYPNYGEKETGIRFEPWHIRYVGLPHADIIYNNKLTLEEYILGLKEGICYEAEEYYIIRQKAEDGTLQIPSGCESYIISPDNTGCYIVTGKKEIAKIRYFETM